MPEVNSVNFDDADHDITKSNTQTNQINDEKYEHIGYHMFQACKKDRQMWWKAGTGRIAFGGTSHNTNWDNTTTGTILPKDTAVVVYDTLFKLSKPS
jgi:hypothetical protein